MTLIALMRFSRTAVPYKARYAVRLWLPTAKSYFDQIATVVAMVVAIF
jgi:hypothetical protein